jgi:hypothetical protein
VQFDDSNDKEILAKINGLDENLWVNVDNSIFNCNGKEGLNRLNASQC